MMKQIRILALDVMTKIKVLIADDHPLFLRALSRFLGSIKTFECVGVAKDGEEAVRLAKELSPDVTLIDVDMPKISGIEAARQIKLSCPNISILILSAYKYDHYAIACIEAGVNGYLLKTAPPDELADAVRIVHAGKSVFDKEIIDKVLHRVSPKTVRKDVGFGELHERELEVLEQVTKGKTNKQISTELGISEHTVGTHLDNVFRKLDVQSRTEAAMVALKRGFISINSTNSEKESGK